MAPGDLLSVEQLTTVFDTVRGSTPAIADVTFSVNAGETLCLVGESGSGKSITALSIVKLLPSPARIASGRVVFDGRDLTALDERAMQKIRGARIGFVFQQAMTALTPVYPTVAGLPEVSATRRISRGFSLVW